MNAQTKCFDLPDDRMVEAENKLRDERHRYLRKQGWEYSSSNPFCAWLWSKTIAGVTYSVGEDSAIAFARREIKPSASRRSLGGDS